MKKEDIRRYVGSMQQLAYTRHVTVHEGRANNLDVVEVKNGEMHYTAMVDKCLDICEMTYKGMQINFLSKPGLNGRNPFDTHGAEAQRSIMCGLFFTCGLENICAPYTDKNGKEYPMHGRIRTSPAEHLCSDAYWDGEDYVLRVSGEIREAELFGENLVLRRTITSVYGKNEIRIEDEVTNEGFEAQPAMLMYHCNFGYPFLHDGVRLLIPTKKVTPREEFSAKFVDSYNKAEAPIDGEQEYVFLHDLANDEDGESFAAVVDDEKKLAVELVFNRKELPYFMEWKSLMSGDYVIGLEPSNSCVYGRKYHEDRGDLNMLKPQETMKKTLTFRVLDGEEEIKALEKKYEEIMK